MFKINKLTKNMLVVVDSLALIIPLACINETPVNARHIYRHNRVVKILKYHNRHSHKYMRIGSTNSYDSKVNMALNKESKNKAYSLGFNDALDSKVNHKLVHNKNYEKGYLQIIALDNYTAPSSNNIPKHLSKNALNDAKVFYNYCILK